LGWFYWPLGFDWPLGWFWAGFDWPLGWFCHTDLATLGRSDRDTKAPTSQVDNFISTVTFEALKLKLSLPWCSLRIPLEVCPDFYVWTLCLGEVGNLQPVYIDAIMEQWFPARGGGSR